MTIRYIKVFHKQLKRRSIADCLFLMPFLNETSYRKIHWTRDILTHYWTIHKGIIFKKNVHGVVCSHFKKMYSSPSPLTYYALLLSRTITDYINKKDCDHRRRKVHDYFSLLLCKSSIWFTEKHIFKIIIYFFNTSKCATNYVISFEIFDGFIGQKILKLWRQESWPFGPGWAAHITSIRSWTFRLPWPPT